jgi:hypothetical protein
MIRRGWTLENIEMACRKEFVSRSVVRVKPLKGIVASAEWESGGPTRVIIDRLLVSELAGTLHEVLHRLLEKELSPFVDYTLAPDGTKRRDAQEVMIDALEEEILLRIRSSERRKAWWRNAIHKRMRK